MMSAIAGSTSDNENSSNLRVAIAALPYSARVTVTLLVLPKATESGSVVSVKVPVTADKSVYNWNTTDEPGIACWVGFLSATSRISGIARSANST